MKKLGFVLLLLVIPPIAPAVAQKSTPKGGAAQSVEGCLLREGADFSLRPLSGGSLVHLIAPSDQDLSRYVGQRLRVAGTEKTPGADASAKSAVPVEKEPAPSTMPSGTPDPKVSVTQLPQSAQAGEGTQGFRGNPANRELYVKSLEQVPGACKPPAARKRH